MKSQIYVWQFWHQILLSKPIFNNFKSAFGEKWLQCGLSQSNSIPQTSRSALGFDRIWGPRSVLPGYLWNEVLWWNSRLVELFLIFSPLLVSICLMQLEHAQSLCVYFHVTTTKWFSGLSSILTQSCTLQATLFQQLELWCWSWAKSISSSATSLVALITLQLSTTWMKPMGECSHSPARGMAVIMLLTALQEQDLLAPETVPLNTPRQQLLMLLSMRSKSLEKTRVTLRNTLKM